METVTGEKTQNQDESKQEKVWDRTKLRDNDLSVLWIENARKMCGGKRSQLSSIYSSSKTLVKAHFFLNKISLRLITTLVTDSPRGKGLFAAMLESRSSTVVATAGGNVQM